MARWWRRIEGANKVAQLSVLALNPWFLPRWWDVNVQQAGAIWELESQRVRLGAARRFGQFKPLYVFRDGQPATPLAQCLAKWSGDGWVIERLIVLPEAGGLRWGEAMAAVLAHLGPGSYRYGHNWSLEASREADLFGLGGVTAGKVQPITVHAVENGQWASDAEWLGAISTNVKRNLKRAREGEPPVVTRWRHGRSALRNLHACAQMRAATMRRLGTSGSLAAELLRRGAAWLAGPAGLLVGIASAGTRNLATVVGYQVGPNFYYLLGGSVPDNNGASWTLLVEAITMWRRQHPAGRFVLGYLDASLDGVAREGLLRQRNSVRKSDFATALVSFSYSGACTAPPKG